MVRDSGAQLELARSGIHARALADCTLLVCCQDMKYG